jgi:predicted ester cyclase
MRVVYHGTHKGAYEGIPPTSKQISVSGLELFMLINGKIVHHWHEMDHLEIFKQIGANAIVPTIE